MHHTRPYAKRHVGCWAVLAAFSIFTVWLACTLVHVKGQRVADITQVTPPSVPVVARFVVTHPRARHDISVTLAPRDWSELPLLMADMVLRDSRDRVRRESITISGEGDASSAHYSSFELSVTPGVAGPYTVTIVPQCKDIGRVHVMIYDRGR